MTEPKKHPDPFPPGSAGRDLLARIREAVPRPALCCPRKPPADWMGLLRGLDDAALLGRAPVDADMAACVRSGLLLRGDDFENSHRISQAIATPTASYWHGILHRREPDFSNARYWFRRTGEHPVFPRLAREVEARFGKEAPSLCKALVRNGAWAPMAWIDLSEAAVRGKAPVPVEVLERVLELEMDLLLDFSVRSALGKE